MYVHFSFVYNIYHQVKVYFLHGTFPPLTQYIYIFVTAGWKSWSCLWNEASIPLKKVWFVVFGDLKRQEKNKLRQRQNYTIYIWPFPPTAVQRCETLEGREWRRSIFLIFVAVMVLRDRSLTIHVLARKNPDPSFSLLLSLRWNQSIGRVKEERFTNVHSYISKN